MTLHNLVLPPNSQKQAQTSQIIAVTILHVMDVVLAFYFSIYRLLVYFSFKLGLSINPFGTLNPLIE